MTASFARCVLSVALRRTSVPTSVLSQHSRRWSSQTARSSNRIVLVTGGANGIGRGIVECFGKESKTTVLCLDVNDSAGLQTEQYCHANGLSEVHYHNLDVSDADACEAFVSSTMQKYGRIDCLVNNAGIQPAVSCVPLHEITTEWWHKVLSVNLHGVFYLSRHVLPIMMAQQTDATPTNKGGGGGVIINVASVQGLQSQAGVPAYAASKGAILSLTRQMANEYGGYGIRVVAVNPGTIETPLVAELLAADGSNFEEAGKPYPLQQRVGQKEEIGHVCVFLASDKASYMHGTDVTVDGGIMAKGGWA
eukprot:m.1516706 g.1516706  ORF g.1516706 m.1516706 type:complete len:307 (+) comp25218_c1_seq7:186-1106(+)